MKRHPARVIQRKRDGLALSAGEIEDFVTGIVDGSVGDAQLGAFLMAVCCRGMDAEETAVLTTAMRDSGAVIDLSRVPGRKVDKHSTGGVGDKVSLVLAPLVAAAGVPVPMISGRGLGHTGGTLDKLASIPGYRTDLDLDEFVAVLRDCGFVMAGPSGQLAPADRRCYAIRDVSGTVESIPLITSSILSKKLASGLDGLVMDVKVGRAAFMKERADAQALMESLVAVGRQAGKEVVALMTDMDTPLGCCIGNGLEVRESIEALRGRGPGDLMEVVLALGAEMLCLAGIAADAAAAEVKLRGHLADGSALERLARNIERQGGDPNVCTDLDLLPAAAVTRSLPAPATGFVADLDPLGLGRVVVDLGGGRRQPEDAVDPGVGLTLCKQRGAPIAAGEPWVVCHAASEAAADQAVADLEALIRIEATAPDVGSKILGACRGA